MSNFSSTFSLAIKTKINEKIIKVTEHVRISSLIINVKKAHRPNNSIKTTIAE
jgi:hypothetical protein